MDIFIEIVKIIIPVILTGIITFLITRYTYRINIPLDKLEKAYNKVYYPIYCLFYFDKSKEYSTKFIIKKCKQYLEKYRKYVDKSTLMAFEILMKSYNELEFDKSSYENFKINISNMNYRLRKRLGYLVPNIFAMSTINITNARKDLYKLVENVNIYSDPTLINGKNGNAVLISEDDYRALQETIYLNIIPGMVESIIEGGNTSLEDCMEYGDDWTY